MDLVSGVLIFLLSTLGLVEVVRHVVMWAYRTKDETQTIVLVAPLGAGDCEMCVRAAAERLSWMEKRRTCRLICLNRNADPEVAEICQHLQGQYSTLVVSNYEDLTYNIKQIVE